MSLDPSKVKDQFLSVVNRLPFRQNTSTTTKADEAQSDHGAGHGLPSGNPSTPNQPRSINVVLFGETGVGKSSVINLIARKNTAKVSSDVNGCTMQSTRYNIPFDGMNFAIFDTIGLEEPQMGVNGYLKAIEKAYELIVELGAAGGIHLLLFCMRGGRITATTQSNYRLFCECLCSTRVPIALVFTGLEREVEMEDWWKRNKTHIEHYGIKSDGHACITAVQDDTPGEDLKYTESQKRIRELLKVCALKSEAFMPEQNSWFIRFGKGMRSFIEKHRNPKRKDVVKVLTRRCKLDPETAKKIADMMEKSEPETKPQADNQNEPAEHNMGESGPGPAARKDEDDGMKQYSPEAEPPSIDGLDEEEDEDWPTNENPTKVDTATLSHGDIETESRNSGPEKDRSGVADQRPSRLRTMGLPGTQRRTVGLDKSGTATENASHHTTAPPGDVVARTRPEKHGSGDVGENAGKPRSLPPQSTNRTTTVPPVPDPPSGWREKMVGRTSGNGGRLGFSAERAGSQGRTTTGGGSIRGPVVRAGH